VVAGTSPCSLVAQHAGNAIASPAGASWRLTCTAWSNGMQLTKAALRTLARLALMTCLSAGALPGTAQAPLPADITNTIRKAYGDGEMHYRDRSVDLNGDGKPEIVVYLISPMVCGTGGCNLFVFTPHGSGYRPVGNTTVTRTPIRASPARSAGWRHLIVHVAGGGGPTGDFELSFNGRRYPGNPSVSGPHVKPAALEGSEVLIDNFASINDTKLLPAAGAAAPPAQAGSGPSFDCAKATSTVEKLICNDAGLAALDRKLAAAYAKGVSPGSDWSDRDKNESRAAQRAWLGERERCEKTADVKRCVTAIHQRRIAELQIKNGEAGPVPPAVGYRCQGLERLPVTAVFYGKTEPPAAVLTVGDRQVIAFIAPSGSGAKYTAPGVEFWEHHGEASLQWFGNSYPCNVL
jgi:uncharacterized protein